MFAFNHCKTTLMKLPSKAAAEWVLQGLQASLESGEITPTPEPTDPRQMEMVSTGPVEESAAE